MQLRASTLHPSRPTDLDKENWLDRSLLRSQVRRRAKLPRTGAAALLPTASSRAWSSAVAGGASGARVWRRHCSILPSKSVAILDASGTRYFTSLNRLADRVRRPQDDHRAARSHHPSLRHRRGNWPQQPSVDRDTYRSGRHLADAPVTGFVTVLHTVGLREEKLPVGGRQHCSRASRASQTSIKGWCPDRQLSRNESG